MKAVKSLLILLCLFAVFWGVFLAPEEADPALDEVAARIVAELPEDIHLRILAVGKFEGQGGDQLRDRLTATLDRDSDFVLVERDRVDSILAEQGFQAGQLVDPNARVRFGEMLGAEGILLGSVEKFDRKMFGGAEIAVQATLDDVQRSSVAFSRRFEVVRTSRQGRFAYLAALLLAFAFVAAGWFEKARLRGRHERLDKAGEKRVDAVSEVRHADRLLGELQTRAAGRDDERAMEIKEIRSRLSDLRLLVESAASGDPDLQERYRDRQILKADSTAVKALVNLRERVEKLARHDRIPDAGNLAELAEQIRMAEAAYRGRKVR